MVTERFDGSPALSKHACVLLEPCAISRRPILSCVDGAISYKLELLYKDCLVINMTNERFLHFRPRRYTEQNTSKRRQ